MPTPSSSPAGKGITECLLPSMRGGGKQELFFSHYLGQAEGSGVKDGTAAVKGKENERIIHPGAGAFVSVM